MTQAGIEPATFRSVAQRLSHCATACFYSQTTWEFKRQSFNFGHPDVLTVTNSEANMERHIPLTSYLIYTRVWKKTEKRHDLKPLAYVGKHCRVYLQVFGISTLGYPANVPQLSSHSRRSPQGSTTLTASVRLTSRCHRYRITAIYHYITMKRCAMNSVPISTVCSVANRRHTRDPFHDSDLTPLRFWLCGVSRNSWRTWCALVWRLKSSDRLNCAPQRR